MNDPANLPQDRPNILQPTNDEARGLARRLVRSARHAALACAEPETGHPLASRVAVATAMDGSPAILISALSGHTPALRADPRCSLLFGEPGKGDPLAHPRISVVGRAEPVARDDTERTHIRQRYLGRHPKAALYVDFADFAFFRIVIERASLNGGFGKAYALSPADLLTDMTGMNNLAAAEAGAVAHMNSDHADAIALYASKLAGASGSGWRIATLDPEGLDLISGDTLIRLDFDFPLSTPDQLRPMLVAMAKQARAD